MEGKTPLDKVTPALVDKIIKDISNLEKTLSENDGQLFLLERTTHIDDYTNVDGDIHIHSGMHVDDEKESIFGISTKPYLITYNGNNTGLISAETVTKWLMFGLLQGDRKDNPKDIEIITPNHFSPGRFYTGGNISNDAFLLKGNVITSYRDMSGLRYEYRSGPTHIRCNQERQVTKFHLEAGDDVVKKIMLKKYSNGAELFEHFKDFLTHPEKIEQLEKYKLNKEKEGIIERIEGMLKREIEVQASIDRVYASMKNGGFMDGGAAVMVETTDDARIVTMRDREKLEEIRNDIRFTLADARKRNMDKDKTEYVVTHTPGKVTKIIISEYITNLTLVYSKIRNK